MRRLLCIVLMSCMLCTVCGCTDDPDYEDRNGWTVQFVTEIGSPTESEIIEFTDLNKALGIKFTFRFEGETVILPSPTGILRYKGEENDYYFIRCAEEKLYDESSGKYEEIIGLRDRGQYVLRYVVVRNVENPGFEDEKYTLFIYAEVI